MQQFADLCFSGKYQHKDIKKMLMGNGGLKAYVGTADVVEIDERINAGEKNIEQVFDAMVYQIAKEIGAMSCVLAGHVDNVILTGGLAHSKRVVNMLKDRTGFIAPLVIYAGEFEMEALAQGVLRVLTGEENAKNYI